MANIFVTYADAEFREAMVRIRRRARSMHNFDKVLVYSPSDLPTYLTQSPLFTHKRGGGYWCWKPYIIADALSKCTNEDVIYYVDAGCVLNPLSNEWKKWNMLMKENDAIFFQYRTEHHYELWDRYCKKQENNNPKIKHWAKPYAIEKLSQLLGNQQWIEDNKIWGGACIIKKAEAQELINEWLHITLADPNIIADPDDVESQNLPESFNVHRHDQVVLTALVHKYSQKCKIKVLKETSESEQDSAAIQAVRFRTGKMTLMEKTKYYLYLLTHPNF